MNAAERARAPLHHNDGLPAGATMGALPLQVPGLMADQRLCVVTNHAMKTYMVICISEALLPLVAVQIQVELPVFAVFTGLETY